MTQDHSKHEGVSAQELAAAKRTARAAARAARDTLDRAACKEASASAADNVLGLPELAAVGLVLVYAALPAELDPLSAVSRLRRRGVKIAYPRIEAPGVLGVHVVDHELDLVAGPFGLAQPSEHAPRIALESIDAVIVPAVAFDLRGHRLGYGGGYYDRLLPGLRREVPRIGMSFDEQILDEIPAEDHDALVDVVVTQTRVIRMPARLSS